MFRLTTVFAYLIIFVASTVGAAGFVAKKEQAQSDYNLTSSPLPIYNISPAPASPFGLFSDFSWRDRVSLRNIDVGMSVIETPNFDVGVQGGNRLGRERSSEATLKGLRPVEDSFEMGIFTQGRYGDYLLGTRLSQDISSGHEGMLGEFMAGYDKRLTDNFGLSLGVGTTWADKNYMSSLYGVGAVQSQMSGLSEYAPGAGFTNTSLHLAACYQFSDAWSVGAQLGYTRLVGEAANSPALKDERIDNFITGLQLQYRLPSLTSSIPGNISGATCWPYKNP
jgi:outer membrane protein